MYLNSTCKCDITPDFFFYNNPICHPTQPKWLILSGRIVGTSKSTSTDILQDLQLWVKEESKLIVQGVDFTTLKYSSVHLQEGKPPFCQNIPSETPSNSPITQPSSDPEPTIPFLLYGIIAVASVLVVLCIIVVSVCVMFIRMKKRKTRSRIKR